LSRYCAIDLLWTRRCWLENAGASRKAWRTETDPVHGMSTSQSVCDTQGPSPQCPLLQGSKQAASQEEPKKESRRDQGDHGTTCCREPREVCFQEITQLVADLAVKVTVGGGALSHRESIVVITQLAADLAVKVAVVKHAF